MKRNERTVYNRLKKSVSPDTLYVEIPLDWSREARQAIHELLTIKYGMFASCIGPDCVTFVPSIRYTHASEYTADTRRAQENADIDRIVSVLRRTEYTWNGYRPSQVPQDPAEQQDTTDTTIDAENAQNGPEKAAGKKEEKNMSTLEKIAADMSAYYTDRSAWNKGVATIAADLLKQYADNYGEDAAAPTMDDLLNGADSWGQYSWGGCYLIYDGDIAELLCTPSELKRTRNGERRPNSREEWLDVQARALNQAARRIINSARRVARKSA